MVRNEILSVLKQRYSNYGGTCSFDEAIRALDGLDVRQNKAGQIYISRAVWCRSDVVIPFGIDFIKAGAFRNQTDLKRVDIQANVTEILRYTFVGCSSLEEILMPDSVRLIREGAFERCTSLERITIPASVKEIKSEAFLGCEALKEINISNPYITIDKSAFTDGISLIFASMQGKGVSNEPSWKKEKAYAEPSHKEEKKLYAEPFHKEEKKLYAEPSHKEEKKVYAEPSHEEEKKAYAEPSHEEEKRAYAEPSHEEEKKAYTEPCIEEEEKAYAELFNDNVEKEKDHKAHGNSVEVSAIEKNISAEDDIFANASERWNIKTTPTAGTKPVEQDESDETVLVKESPKQDAPVRKKRPRSSLYDMKMLLCADVRLGAICTEKLDVKSSHKWQADRSKKLADLMDKAAQNNAAYVVLLGQMFGQPRISESIIDGLFQTVKGNMEILTMAFLGADEYKRISYRNDIPENLYLFCLQKQDSYVDDDISIKIDKGVVEILTADNDSLWIKKNEEDKFVLSGLPEHNVIPSFEPIGYEEAQGMTCGYGILERTDDKRWQYIFKEDQRYAYRSLEQKILPEDDQQKILQKINDAVSGMEVNTFLRITISGRSAFGLTINVDGVKEWLQKRIFFVEAYDNTVMDIDAEAFENDISLRGEFVRLALQDDSLSESERNRLISCGWNALNGEVSAK